MDMDDAFNRVVDRQTFFEFVQALIKDRTD